MTARWEQVLDSIERGAVDAVRRFTSLAEHTADRAAPVAAPADVGAADLGPTGDLGPLPAHLEDRARAVLACVDDAHELLRRVPRPVVEHGRTRFSSSEHGAAVTFDRTI